MQQLSATQRIHLEARRRLSFNYKHLLGYANESNVTFLVSCPLHVLDLSWSTNVASTKCWISTNASCALCTRDPICDDFWSASTEGRSRRCQRCVPKDWIRTFIAKRPARRRWRSLRTRKSLKSCWLRWSTAALCWIIAPRTAARLCIARSRKTATRLCRKCSAAISAWFIA